MSQSKIISHTKDILKKTAEQTGYSYDKVENVYYSFIKALEKVVDEDVYSIKMLNLGTFYLNNRYLREIRGTHKKLSPARKGINEKLTKMQRFKDYRDGISIHDKFTIEMIVNDLLGEQKELYNVHKENLRNTRKIIKKVEDLQNGE